MDNPVVIDYGSETIKAGYANNVPSADEPRVVTPTAAELRDGGDAIAAKHKSSVAVAHPVQRGIVTDLDQLEALLDYTLYGLLGWRRGGEVSPVLLVEPLLTARAAREALVQRMFEAFNVPGLFVQDSAVAALSAAGRGAGVVVDFGHGKTDIAAVADGLLHAPGVRRLAVAGADLDAALAERLPSDVAAALKAASATTSAASASSSPAAALAALKAAAARTAASGADYLAAARPGSEGDVEESYTLPDGQVVKLPRRVGLALGEALVRPATLLASARGGGGGSTTSTTITTTGATLAEAVVGVTETYPDVAARRGLLDAVLLVGGGASIPGLPERLLAEALALAPPGTAPSLAPPPDYMPPNTARYAPYVGGAVVAKVVAGVAGGAHWMTRGEYEELGPGGVHRRCA